MRQWEAHDKRIWSVDFCPLDPTTFATGSDDCTIKVGWLGLPFRAEPHSVGWRYRSGGLAGEIIRLELSSGALNHTILGCICACRQAGHSVRCRKPDLHDAKASMHAHLLTETC